MPRKARVLSRSGIYHIIMRGINRQTIFWDEEDRRLFMHALRHYKKTSQYRVYAYCLMNNHVHILLKTEKEPLQQIMRRICGKFVYWYNKKYQRIGYLFQDRFKSEPVEDEAYCLTVHRYIHRNPLKAGIVSHVGQYKWSSYNEYMGQLDLVDVDFILSLFGADTDAALQAFIQYNCTDNQDVCLEMDAPSTKISDEEALAIICRVCQVESATELKRMDRQVRDKLIRQLKVDYGLSVRQIERLTGISRATVHRA